MRATRRRLIIWLGAGVAASVALACQAPAPAAPTGQPAAPSTNGPQPVRGGNLTVALSAEPVDTDPGNTGGVPTAAVEQMIYNGLVRQTPDQQIKPDLATSWTVDDVKWTLKLRQGVRFHDGTPFNAQAVKTMFDRYLTNTEKLRRAGDWLPVLDSVQVIDDSTVLFQTKGIDAYFLTRLAGEVGIPSPTALARFGKDYLKSPVGTGPFKFKEWVPGVSFTVVRNDDYFGDKALLDQVTMRPIPEDATRALSLETGEVQLATPIAPEQITRLQGNANVQIVSRATALNLMFGMNNLKKPFDNLQVRQALNYAIDRDAIVKNVYSGLAQAMQGAIPPAAIGYSPVEGYAYDPNKARQMLSDAGYPNGFSVSLTGTKGRYFKDFELMQAVQQYLKTVGVTTNIEIVEWARYLELVRLSPDKTPMEMWLDGYNGNTAQILFNQRWNCNGFTPVGINVHGFCDNGIDQLVLQSQRTLDESKRNELLAQAQTMISKDAPSIWGVASVETTGMSKKLHNPLIYKSELVTVDEHTWLEA